MALDQMKFDVARFVDKLSPKKGDVIILRVEDQHNLEALGQAQGVLDQLMDLAKAGHFDSNIPLVILYGQDRLECLEAECLGYMQYIKNAKAPHEPHQVVFAQHENGWADPATVSKVYLLKDGRILAIPVKSVLEVQ